MPPAFVRRRTLRCRAISAPPMRQSQQLPLGGGGYGSSCGAGMRLVARVSYSLASERLSKPFICLDLSQSSEFMSLLLTAPHARRGAFRPHKIMNVGPRHATSRHVRHRTLIPYLTQHEGASAVPQRHSALHLSRPIPHQRRCCPLARRTPLVDERRQSPKFPLGEWLPAKYPHLI